MKELIIKLYNIAINYLIEFFHAFKKETRRKIKRFKRKIKKIYLYEVLGVLTVATFIRNIALRLYNKDYIQKSVNYIKNISKNSYKNVKKNTLHIYRLSTEFVDKTKINLEDKKTIYKEEYSKFMTPKILSKSFILIVLSVFIIYDAYSWFYNEYESKGTVINLGTIEHEINQYNDAGTLIGTNNDTITVIEEDNMGITTRKTRYVEIKNVGSLDLDYNMSFILDGTTSNAGVLYYRVIDITDQVISSTITPTYNTKLKAYAAANPTPANLETAATNPVSNLTTITQLIVKGTIEKDNDDLENNIRYYRIDYGMYQTINSSLYSGASVAVHTSVHSVQSGINDDQMSEGEIWLVENESQFRDALLNALSGDTIKLVADIDVDGSAEFSRRVHLDTDTYNLRFTGDLVFDFVEVGNLNIDTSGGGKIDVGGDFYVSTPKSQVHFLGQNGTYDIFVGGDFTVSGIQNEEEDGVLLEGVRIVKNKVGNIPVDVIVLSNTRLTIAPNVEVGYVIGATGSTNIEILNNGTITQIQLQNMNLIDSFSKYQIYVYNLNTILGVLGGSSIILPSNATPYTGPNTGNTLIVRGVSSNDITVSGTPGFTGDDITQGAPTDSVIPIQGEPNSYYVFIRSNNESLQGLLTNYFDSLDPATTTQEINNIKKLIIYTINSSYFENADFTYIASSNMPNIEYLGLANATIVDGVSVNTIAANTLKDKTSLKTVILSKTLATVGANAFENVNLGRIQTDGSFTFMSIPSTVTNIGANAFGSSKYVKFEGQIPPTVGSGAFDDSSNGTRFFVSPGAINLYRGVTNINEAFVYYHSNLSDNNAYFLYDDGDGYGIAYYVSSISIGTALTIPNNLTLNLISKPVTAIGFNAFRHITTAAAGATITIPNTVTLIDSYAFYGTNVKSMNLENILRINDYSFYNTRLTTLTMNNITHIGSHAFHGVPLTYLSLENINTISSYAFYNNTTLYEVNLGRVKVIGDYAFYNCPQIGRVWFKNTETALVNNAEQINLTVGETAVFTNWGQYLDGRLRVYVPTGSSQSGLDYLTGYKRLFSANSAFIYPVGIIIGSYQHVAIPYDWGEYSVRSVTKNNALGQPVTAYEIIEYHGADKGNSSPALNGTITANGETLNIVSIGNYAFYGTSVISGQNWNFVLPNSVIRIDDYAFYQTNITSIQGNQITRIGKYAFADCERLTTAIFSGVVQVDDYALYSCGIISYIDLGTGIQSFGAYALWNPYQGGPSTTLNMLTTTVPTTASTSLPDYERGFLGLWYNSNFTISLPSSAVSTFENTAPWRYHHFTSSSYSSNFLYVLDNNNEITITSYTGSATSVVIPDTLPVSSVQYNVTSIKGNAFDSNTTLTSVTLPRYLKTLGDGFLSGNTVITTLTANASSTVFTSSNGILFDITGRTLIRYPNGKTATSYSVPSTVYVVAYKAFEKQTRLTSVTFSSSLVAMGAYAFQGCTAITTFTFSGPPPYLTGFGTFPKNSNMLINVPSASLSQYNAATYFAEYSTYLRGV